MTKDPTPFRSAILAAKHHDEIPTPPRLRALVWRSALLNLGVGLTSLPVIVAAASPEVILTAVFLILGVSLLIWVATMAAYVVLRLHAAARTRTIVAKTRAREAALALSADLADPWLDATA